MAFDICEIALLTSCPTNLRLLWIENDPVVTLEEVGAEKPGEIDRIQQVGVEQINK